MGVGWYSQVYVMGCKPSRVVRADIRYSVEGLCAKVAGDTEVERSLRGGETPNLG